MKKEKVTEQFAYKDAHKDVVMIVNKSMPSAVKHQRQITCTLSYQGQDGREEGQGGPGTRERYFSQL